MACSGGLYNQLNNDTPAGWSDLPMAGLIAEVLLSAAWALVRHYSEPGTPRHWPLSEGSDAHLPSRSAWGLWNSPSKAAACVLQPQATEARRSSGILAERHLRGIGAMTRLGSKAAGDGTQPGQHLMYDVAVAWYGAGGTVGFVVSLATTAALNAIIGKRASIHTVPSTRRMHQRA